MSEENRHKRIGSTVSKYHVDKLNLISGKLNLPVSRLVAIAIDNEFDRENPFIWDLTLPDDEIEEFAYADQAGKLIRYLTEVPKGMPLDMLILFRHEVGITSKDELRHGLVEALNSGLVVMFYPKAASYIRPDTLYYRIKGAEKRARQVRKKANEYERYQKLKKKYEDK